jgi:hypothetical protein
MQHALSKLAPLFLTTGLALAAQEGESSRGTTGELAPPVRLEADGAPIDIGKLANIAHAGPWIADVDGDGDRDLLVGDFPGYLWHFENVGRDAEPKYALRGKLQAGGKDAKTPVY